MIYSEGIIGKYIKLRFVTEDDAEYIIRLRTNEKNSKYIHTTSSNITLQREWIINQQNQEGDFYFIMLNFFDHPIGLISLYNISNKTAECGRWISEGNAFENLEAAKLIHDFGFDVLSLDSIYTCTAKDNVPVVNFWKRFGGEFHGYISNEPFMLYKNFIDKNMYQEEICKRINNLLYKRI